MKKNAFAKGLIILLALLLTGFSAAALGEGGGVEVYGEHSLPPYVLAGNALQVGLPGVSGTVSYEISFRDTEDNWAAVRTKTGSYADEDGVNVNVPTTGLAPGLWNVRVILRDPDGGNVYFRSGVTNLTESAPAASGLTFVVSDEEREVNQASKFWAYAPGAAGVAIDVDGYAVDEQGECCTFAWIYDYPGTCAITATAYYPDGTSRSEAQYVAVTGGEAPFAFEPVISEITEEDGLTVLFDRVTAGDKNVYYDLTIDGMNDGYRNMQAFKNALETGDENDDTIHRMPATGQMVFTVPSGELMPGGLYHVALSAYADGVLPVTAKKWLLYREGAVSDDVTLTVNGLDDEDVSVQTKEPFIIRVDFPEGTTDVRFFNGTECRYLHWEEDWEKKLAQGYWTMSFADNWPNTWAMYAQATSESFDPEQADPEALSWGDMSNMVRLHVAADGGPADGATVTLSAHQVAQGESLAFEVSDYGSEVDFLWCWIESVGNRLSFNGTTIYRPQTGGVLSTAELEPGLYKLCVNCESQTQGLSVRETQQYFIVTAPEDPDWDDEDHFIFRIEPATGLLAHEGFAVTIRRPGAKALRLRGLEESGNREQYGFWSADTVGEITELVAGTYTLWADAYVGDSEEPWDDEENWVSSEQITLTVGRLDDGRQYAIQAEDVIDATAEDDYTFYVQDLDRADWWWDVRISKIDHENGWTDVWRCTSDDRLAATAEDPFRVDRALLEPGCAYEISVWADARDYGGRSAVKRVYVTDGATDGNITLMAYTEGDDATIYGVDGEGAPVDAQIDDFPNRQTLHLEAIAPGATALRVFDGEDWDFVSGFKDGHAWFTVRPEAERCLYFVSACYEELDGDDWRDLPWSGDISNVIRLNIACGEELSDAEATLSGLDENGEILRGDLLTVTVTNADEAAENFNIFLRDSLGQDYRGGAEWSFESGGLPLEAQLSTAELPVNRPCYVVVESGAVGRSWHRTLIGPFTVRERGDLGAGEMLFYPYQLEYLAEEEIYRAYRDQEWRFALCAPGADRVIVTWQYLDEEEDGLEWWYGESAVDRWREGREGLYRLSAAAYDAEDNEIASHEGYTVRIESHGRLQDPAIDVETVFDVANEDALRFAVTGLAQEGADWWHIKIFDTDALNEEDNWLLVCEENADSRAGAIEDPMLFAFPASLFTAGHRYEIEAWVDGSGWDGAQSETYIFAADGVDDNITLLVNDGTDPVTGCAHVNEGEGAVDIRVRAPGAVAVRLFNGNDWEYYDLMEGYNAVMMWGHWFDSGEYTLFAQACYQDRETIDWDNVQWETLDWGTATSNSVAVTITSLGEGDGAVLDQESYTVIRGELLAFSIVSAGSGETRGTHFHAFIEDEYGGVDWSNELDLLAPGAEDLPLSGSLTTGYLEAGRPYWLVVDACAPRYDWSRVRIPIIVEEPEGDDIVFTVEEPVYRNLPFRLSAFASGASWMTVEVRSLNDDDSFEWGPWYGDFINARDMYLEAGLYALTAVAHYVDENGEEAGTRTSEPVALQVGYLGDMPAPEFACTPLDPADVRETHIFGLTGLPDGEDDWYDIRIHDIGHDDYENDQDDTTMIWRATPHEWADGTDNGIDGDGVHWFTIPQGTLIAGRAYSVDVWADRPGWRGAEAHTTFYAWDGETDENVVLSVDEAELWTAQDTTIRISAPAGTAAVRFWTGERWEYRGDVDPDTGYFETGFSWDSPGEYDIYACATNEVIDWNSFDGDWEGLTWSGISNTVGIQILSRGSSSGELTVTPVNLEGGVVRGDMARVVIDCAGNVDPETIGNRVDVSIRDADNDFMGDSYRRYENVSFPFTVGLPTADIEAGHYHVVVSVCGLGYEWVETWTEEDPDDPPALWFDIVEPEAGITFSADKADVLVGEDFRFSVYAPGAIATSVCLARAGNDEDLVWEIYNSGPRATETVNVWEEAGGMNLYAYALYDEGEDWVRSDPDDDIAITVRSLGALDPVSQQWTSVVWQGTAPRFRFTPVDGAEWYQVGIVDLDRGFLEECSLRFEADEVPDGWITLPNSGDLAAGKVYIVGVDAFARGYTIGSAENSPRVAVVDENAVLYLPEALTTIDEEAFAETQAQMIVLPDGVESVGSRAFMDCLDLVAVVSPIELPGDAFMDCPWDVVVTDSLPE